MKIKEKIEDWVRQTLNIEKVDLAHPKDLKNGDYSFFAGKNADEYAEALRQAQGDLQKQIEKIETAGNFINFYLSKVFFAEAVEEINEKGADFTKATSGEGKIIIEYTNTNVLKPMHIGHLMGNIIGQSISNILETGGAEIKRNTYQGDTGPHIAKAIWGKMQKLELEWGAAYAYGAENYENNKNEIDDINKKIFEKSDEKINELYKEGRKESLENFEKIYKKLDTKFDYYFFESEVAEDAVSIVKEFANKKIFEESEGAIIFRAEKYDSKLHTRVFVTGQGIPTYEAKDIAHALRKEKEFKSDKSIIITANEQKEYFKVMLKALEQINPEVALKTEHLSHGMLRLPTGKMSSRTGDVITAESLIEQVKDKIFEKIKDREFSDAEKGKISEMVAIGAIKYSILRQAIGGDIVFDFDKSISFEGDSGPYLQYTAVRANSVLEKAKNLTSGPSPRLGEGRKEVVLNNWEITELERYLYRFSEVVERAGIEYAPHHIVNYLLDLAASFNHFYAEEKIIDESDPESPYKIAMTEAVFIVLQNGLRLLGIKVPERM